MKSLLGGADKVDGLDLSMSPVLMLFADMGTTLQIACFTGKATSIGVVLELLHRGRSGLRLPR